MPYPLPPLRFSHRIVGRSGKYKIESTCLRCGAQKEATLTEGIVDWEKKHKCEEA